MGSMTCSVYGLHNYCHLLAYSIMNTKRERERELEKLLYVNTKPCKESRKSFVTSQDRYHHKLVYTFKLILLTAIVVFKSSS